ncbi:outer membrane protein transport protein [Sulfurimonas sp.]|uniref:OmpP1/FadL family transporter n=1 Tax=Sulfurimonas sp. TaxID=2022749 RepID=UPI00260DFEF6|nr:outer membrane protein transport protein [Sulfurimonas sp.]
MKKTIKLAVVAALALSTTSAFATNGSALIGLGAKSRAMGGTSIGVTHGAESGLSNPALITSVEGTEVSFGGTFFMPDVKNTNNIGGGDSTETSAADLSVIPEVSIATKITDNFYVGVGMFGTAGMGVDYRDTDAVQAGGTQFNMVTNLQLMQFGVPLAYTISGFSVAVTPLLQYGSLDINYVGDDGAGNAVQNGAGVAQDLQFGYNLGLSYEISDFTLGVVYKSQIDMDYKDQLVNAMSGFGVPYTNTELSTPAEIGVGVSYVYGSSTIALDYKQIKWSDAKGYEDFKWEDQNVYALGYEYEAKTWALRAGYNYAKSPISEQKLGSLGALPSGADMAGLLNTFNLLGFPGIVESHYTLGGSYALSEQTSVDLAYTYAPEVTNTYKNFVGQDITTKHSQQGVSFQLNYDF